MPECQSAGEMAVQIAGRKDSQQNQSRNGK
jgi:hypothetical protein